MIARNPARGVKVPRSEAKEARYLSASEVEAIAEATDERYRALVLLLGFGGLRIGEAVALRVGNLDLLRRRVNVLEAASEVRGAIYVGPPKTKQSVRAVALPAFIVDALAAHLAAFPPSDSGLVFTSPEGQMLRRTNFRRRVWIPALLAAGVEEPLPHVHHLRHSAAALMIAAGGHPKQIQAQLGHASVGVTLDRYGHLFEGLADDLAERVGDLRSTPGGTFVARRPATSS